MTIMTKKVPLWSLILAGLFFLLIFPKKVYAYIDPGTGSFLFQIIAATLLTLLISARKVVSFFHTLYQKLFSRRKNSNDKSS
ncbi:hypothetical protein A2W14_07085 [Candidatus Gottesmanbacteria bacterium RBG_16_37_8]|uniref:Uncharacterized protein n=1 Tax=Candidatus Gottesmanbacteria bacterium RBG_16_37_8 TaxID=1798371 RepID=A0A1F5YW46_9BACT|nr:MAG: hypothetical protein A2W14_07085 [Candidatus Gottesmanbacteria bacterium RBG_16_37_8]